MNCKKFWLQLLSVGNYFETFFRVSYEVGIGVFGRRFKILNEVTSYSLLDARNKILKRFQFDDLCVFPFLLCI